MNRVVKDDVMSAAVSIAEVVIDNDPDSVIAMSEGLRKGWVGKEAEAVNERLFMGWGSSNELENYKEGISAFVEERRPRWVASKH